ncbi:MAG: SpoIVB peptidase [Oscillospiraceae bacterium]|nr:SpoIVB peptidase [Oscillospiraceae bacterium]
MRKYIKAGAILINALIIGLLLLILYYNHTLPNNYYVTAGSELRLTGVFEAVRCVGDVSAAKQAAAYSSSADGISSHKAELRLLGIIPIKTINIREVKEPVLIPCGEPFGIKLLTDGVVVVEVSGFYSDGGFVSPAATAGIRVGDIIKYAGGQRVSSNEEIEAIMSQSGGQAVSVNLEREEKAFEATVYPALCKPDDSYRAGMWVRDSSAGIGTITFYNPNTGMFAGLGHPVCDVDTGKIMPLRSGEVIKVMINGVKKGKSGAPGELAGMFISDNPIGILGRNSKGGLFGHMNNGFNPSNQGLPLGMRQEIETGEAYIYSTVKGTAPSMYKIIIEKIDFSDSDNGKNMIIRVIDEELLAISGGIVQGMSGSPIVQNGKLVGAVTHVFINNPAKGYAIFADYMYDESLKAQADLFALDDAA